MKVIMSCGVLVEYSIGWGWCVKGGIFFYGVKNVGVFCKVFRSLCVVVIKFILLCRVRL